MSESKQAPTFDASVSAQGLRVMVIGARFNSFVGERLIEGALDALRRHGAADEAIRVLRVPGAFEIPALLGRAVDSGDYDAAVVLGCVIRGETPHFDYVAGECARGVAEIARGAAARGIGVGFGVLTTNTLEQAIERAGAKSGNKGAEAALVAVEMTHLLRGIVGRGKP